MSQVTPVSCLAYDKQGLLLDLGPLTQNGRPGEPDPMNLLSTEHPAPRRVVPREHGWPHLRPTAGSDPVFWKQPLTCTFWDA